MTEQVAEHIIAYACDSKFPETYIEEKYLIHIADGKSFWEYLLKAADEYGYSNRIDHLKDRLKNYCATRLQDVSNKEGLEKQLQQKDVDIIELTRANLKLQNEYLPHAIGQLTERKRYFWYANILTIIGTLAGAILGSMLTADQLKDQTDNQAPLPTKDAILIHDTIYQTIYDTILVTKRDTLKVK